MAIEYLKDEAVIRCEICRSLVRIISTLQLYEWSVISAFIALGWEIENGYTTCPTCLSASNASRQGGT